MLVHQLVLCISLSLSHGVPDSEHIRSCAKTVLECMSHLIERAEAIELAPHDSLQYHGPRDTLDGWTEGPVVG